MQKFSVPHLTYQNPLMFHQRCLPSPAHKQQSALSTSSVDNEDFVTIISAKLLDHCNTNFNAKQMCASGIITFAYSHRAKDKAIHFGLFWTLEKCALFKTLHRSNNNNKCICSFTFLKFIEGDMSLLQPSLD